MWKSRWTFGIGHLRAAAIPLAAMALAAPCLPVQARVFSPPKALSSGDRREGPAEAATTAPADAAPGGGRPPSQPLIPRWRNAFGRFRSRPG